jgi:hypothetical protein
MSLWRHRDHMVVGFVTSTKYIYIYIYIYMQSVPVTTKILSDFESSSWRHVLDTTLCDKVCQ